MNQVTVTQVQQPRYLHHSRNAFIRGRILILKKFDKPLTTYKSNYGAKKTPDPTYDRMVIIGELNSPSCFAVISKTPRESSNLFKDRSISVGCIVDVLEPVPTGSALGNDSHNPIFEVKKPFVRAVVNDTPEIATLENPNTAAIFHFAFNGTLSLAILFTNDNYYSFFHNVPQQFVLCYYT